MPALSLTPEAVEHAIELVREQHIDELIPSELAWLDHHNTLAKIAVDSYVKDESGKDTLTAGQLGLLVGSIVMRTGADTGLYDYEDVRSNHRQQLVGMKFAYKHELADDDISELLGDAAKPLLGFKNTVTRGLSAVFMGVSMNPERPKLIKDFVAFPDGAIRRRPSSAKRQARG